MDSLQAAIGVTATLGFGSTIDMAIEKDWRGDEIFGCRI